MAVKIISTYTPKDYDLGHFTIDLKRKTAVLIRQSMKKANKDHYESRLLQENLVPIAMKLRGEMDETNILVYDEGAGVSGTKGYDEREKLSALYLAIANDIVGSLLVARPDRLFRDKHFLNVGMFTELAEKKKLILIVPGKRIYDFTKYSDLQAFQKDMQDAYGYIATHVKYMNDARYQKMLRGLYGGGNLPAPYVINRTAWKDEQIPIIYQPWLEPAIDLFKHFKAWDFSLSRMCRYIESVPYLFPAPSDEDIQRYLFRTQMRLVQGGYTFSDVSTVKYYLSNLTLGGYAKVGKDEDGNTLLLPNAFEAAIPLDLLDPAYAALTGHHIDGAPFESQRNTRRYMRSDPQGPKVLFSSSILGSDQGHITADIRATWGHYRCHKGFQQAEYNLKIRSGLLEAKILWVVPASELDNIIVERLFHLAQHDHDMAERIKVAFESLKGQKVSEANLLNGQIERLQQRINRLDFLLKNPDIPLDVETAREYAQTLAELRPQLARLIKKQQIKPELDPEATIKNFYFILAHLPTEFKKQDMDVQRQMMSKLVKRIVVNNISPHLFYLYITWHDGIATRPDVALLWRGTMLKDNGKWNKEEYAILRAHWPTDSSLEVMKHLPLHSWNSIGRHAQSIGVVRSKRQKINPYHDTMCYSDLEAAMNYAENGEDKTYMCEKVNELAKKTHKGKVSAYWPLPVDVVGYSGFVSDGEGCSGIFPSRAIVSRPIS